MSERDGDAWDVQVAAAEADLKAYAHNLARFGGEGCCLAIEEAWGLDGYPPEVVSAVLAGVAGGMVFEEALDAAIGAEEDDGCCQGCGACPGFTGADCDGTCAWAKAMESPLSP